MPEIRKDPATRSKGADIMAASPPVRPQTPLEQLQLLILGRQQLQSSTAAHTLPSEALQPQIHFI